jgi:anti-sigma regulatory factor (Ser/Thr protein kinase)
MSRTIGPVSLNLPPDPSLSRVVRLAASGVASLADCTVDEIDDIKIAVSEVLIALIEHGSGNPIELKLGVDDGTFLVAGSTQATSFDIDNPDLVLCRRVLGGVGAEHGVELSDGVARIWATVRHATIE